jgi:hypothetical protein
MIQLLEVVENAYPTPNSTKFTIREVYINPEHIIMVREDYNIKRLLAEQSHFAGQDSTLLNPNMKFSKITVNRGTTGQDMSVAGSVEVIYSKIEESNAKAKKLLRG